MRPESCYLMAGYGLFAAAWLILSLMMLNPNDASNFSLLLY